MFALEIGTLKRGNVALLMTRSPRPDLMSRQCPTIAANQYPTRRLQPPLAANEITTALFGRAQITNALVISSSAYRYLKQFLCWGYQVIVPELVYRNLST